MLPGASGRGSVVEDDVRQTSATQVIADRQCGLATADDDNVALG
jgi:hypothetical protein